MRRYAAGAVRVSLTRLSLVLFGQALRALARHPGRTMLTATGIAIGVAAVVWVVALGREGARRATDLLRDLGDNLVWVESGTRNAAGVRTGTKTATTLTLGDAAAIAREVDLIRLVSPQVDGSVQIVTESANWSTRSRGVAPSYLTIKRFTVAAGAPFTDADLEAGRNVLVMGETVRARLFGDASPVGQLVRVNGQPFQVVGVLAPKGQSATGMDQDDVIMVPYTTALKKLRAQGVVYLDDIVCAAVSPESVAPAAEQVATLVRERHRIGIGDEDDFNIRHPEEVVKAQLAASETFSTLLVAIASVSLLVGGIGIMNVMLASVTERTREIGVRLAVGASSHAVTLQFLTESVLLCLFGGVLGVLASFAGGEALGRLVGWTLSVPLEALGIAIAICAAVGVLFGWLPARRAANLDPIEALRSE